jgi:hypothetical protein
MPRTEPSDGPARTADLIAGLARRATARPAA